MKHFIQIMSPKPNTTILDVGGYPGTWEKTPINARITTLNIHAAEPRPSQFSSLIETVVGDGCNLPYEDKAFDIVFSNSVIEHLSTFERQVAFAHEARRVGKALWIQTPARSFFIEPHLMAPFVHYLPMTIQKKLLRRFTLWGLLGKPSSEEIDTILSEVRLLSKSEMRQLFPDCKILHERFVGFTKSLIALRLTSCKD
jgi:SAM-dependent methyltransferase